MSSRWTTRIVVFAALICWSAYASAQLLSPGPLAGPHASLEGDDKCGRCHSSGRGVSNGLCAGCHGNVTKGGLHARAFSGPCAKCHPDHRGRGFSLVRFSPSGFDHGQTGWQLKGKHSSTKCNSCHKGRGYLGLGSGCTSCHKDPHSSRFGGNCTGCHNENSWKQVSLSKFDHNVTRFPLRGAHGKAACVNCHGSPARYTGIDFGGCTSCHKDPHGGRFSTTCTNCHNENSWHNISMKPGVHPGLSLSNGHQRVKCGACHDKGHFNRPSRGPRCNACHKPVHKADFGNSCEKCHRSIKWLGIPKKIGLSAHDKTVFALRGLHKEAKCEGCHKPEMAAEKRFRQLSFGRCNNCHSDAHKGEFSRRNKGECGPCHTENGFAPTKFDISMHASAAFAIRGRHAAVPCGKCHADGGTVVTDAPDADDADEDDPKSKSKWKSKKRKSKKKKAKKAHVTKHVQRLSWKVKDSACADCHQNPHGDQFASVMKSKGCAGCHVAAGWKTPRIDHKTWPLTGAHAHAPCDRCHSPTPEDRKAGKGSSYKNTPRTCDGCHADVHAGQFRLSEPKRACDSCHTTAKFKFANFDHKKVTGFPLDGKHNSLTCEKCHKQETLPNGTRALRYRLGYKQCRQCHADPHGDEG